MIPFALLVLLFAGQISPAQVLGALRASAPAQSDSPVELYGAGSVSTTDDELNFSVMPSGTEAYFSKYLQAKNLGLIVQTRLVAGKWTEPEVAPFSGQYVDFDPFVSPDGSRLYFISNRPIAQERKTDFDIWYVDREGASWGAPKRLPEPINTLANEYFPSVSQDGTLYFSTVREGGLGRYDIYMSRQEGGIFQSPVNLGAAVNTGASEIDNAISADGRLLVFAATGRPDDTGRGDLYVSVKGPTGWSPARPLSGGVNSSAREYAPAFSPDGRWLFFTSYRGFGDHLPSQPLTFADWRRHLDSVLNGLGNIYRAEVSRVLPADIK